MRQTDFTSNSYELERALIKYNKSFENKHLCYSLGGIFLSLTLALVTSDFKSIIGFSSDQITTSVWIIFLFVIIALIYNVLKYFTQMPQSVEDFCESFIKKSQEKFYEPTCLFVFRRYDQDDSTVKILAFWHIPTKSYYIPYTSFAQEESIPYNLKISKLQ